MNPIFDDSPPSAFFLGKNLFIKYVFIVLSIYNTLPNKGIIKTILFNIILR